MKKTLVLLIVIAIGCFIFAGCDLLPDKLSDLFGTVPDNTVPPQDDSATHSHNFVIDENADDLPTCTEEGHVTYVCSCGEKQTKYASALGHDYKTTVTAPTDTEIGYTTYTCHCGSSYKADYTAELSASVGLEFNGNQVVGIGSCTDADIVIPTVHNGKFIKSIGYMAFANQTQIISVKMPDTICFIDYGAFARCSSLKSIYLPAEIYKIYIGAFDDCTSLCEVHISDFVKWCDIEFEAALCNPLYWAGNLYLNGELVTELVFPEGTTKINDCQFVGIKNINRLVIPEGITEIGEYAFAYCKNIESVELPSTLYSLGNYSFFESGISEITYNGTLSEWNHVYFDWTCIKLTPVLEVKCKDGEFDLTPYKS